MAESVIKTYTEKPESCAFCDWETDELVECDAYACTPGHGPCTPEDQKQRRWLCNVCRSTMAGNACLYPTLPDYRESRVVLKTIAWATNAILDAIKRGK